jgi:acyl-CoA thioester hydrolase
MSSAIPTTEPSQDAALPALPLYVRFADVDMMRIAHHAAYLHWFEQLRFHFLNTVLGLDYETLAREGLRFPLIGCTLEFLKPVAFGANPLGHVRLEYGRTSLLVFHYELTDEQGAAVHARGSTTHCCVDHSLKVRLRFPKFFEQAAEQGRARFPSSLCEGSPRFVRQKRS